MVRDVNTCWFHNLLALSSAPYWPFFYFRFLIFLLTFKSVWRNSTKLLINDPWEQTRTPACFQTVSLTAATPIGHFYFRFWSFLIILETHLMDFNETSHKWMQGDVYSSWFSKCPPTAAPSVCYIFISDFDFIVLIFKIVWWISAKLHTNDRFTKPFLPQQRWLFLFEILSLLCLFSNPFDGLGAAVCTSWKTKCFWFF